ncbi:unnamed protein product (mitochondrion) [Plasmodiophora brassicae]|uniref:Probable nicotinate-nucleotide pyrophosphorylase [carboxylating] n=1 Tax=Plasmodiophora brassicae TaxID=37360 RepID=A0A3P3YHB1_PLABS|nr:unnamed protein product [Plasmodiophora brassicae]
MLTELPPIFLRQPCLAADAGLQYFFDIYQCSVSVTASWVFVRHPSSHSRQSRSMLTGLADPVRAFTRRTFFVRRKNRCRIRSRSVDATMTSLSVLIKDALVEDLGTNGDVTTLATVPQHAVAQATFLVKGDGVVAGYEAVRTVFEQLDPEVYLQWDVEEGSFVRAGTPIGKIAGSARAVLSGERLALNIMQRMSGIATTTRAMVDKIRSVGSQARLLDTRKTAPLNRVLDKRAVEIGGGVNHRFGLYDAVMIKDNHIKAAGSITAAFERVQAYLNGHQDLKPMEIVVEARTLHEVRETTNKVDASVLQAAVDFIAGKVPTEASGNVSLETVADIAATGVDYISSGMLTHSVNALDISLKIFSMQAQTPTSHGQ